MVFDLSLSQDFWQTTMAVFRGFGAFFLQSLCRCFSRLPARVFRVSFVYEQQVYIGKEIRLTNVYQILVHYDEEI